MGKVPTLADVVRTCSSLLTEAAKAEQQEGTSGQAIALPLEDTLQSLFGEKAPMGKEWEAISTELFAMFGEFK